MVRLNRPPCISPLGWRRSPAMPERSDGPEGTFLFLLEKIKTKDGWPAHGTAPQPRSRGKACLAWVQAALSEAHGWGKRMSFECPACHSENTNKLALAYETGLSDVKTRTSGVGIGIGGGGIGLGIGGGKTKGTAQTQASQRAAPPPKKKLVKPLLIIFVITMVLSLLFLSNKTMQDIITLAWIAASAGWVAWAFYFNIKLWPPLKRAWDQSFICNRCGNVFQPSTTLEAQ